MAVLVNGVRYRKPPSDTWRRRYLCDSCRIQMVVEVNNEIRLDEQPCPECTEPMRQHFGATHNRFSETYTGARGTYDRGLGCYVKNQQHRRDICKARGLTPVDGDYDIESIYSGFDSRREKEEREYAEYCDRLDNDPAFRGYREAQDKGQFTVAAETPAE